MQSLINYQWIETNEQLAIICAQAKKTKAVALDTEFIRIRTYYPILGLIQLFDGKQVSLIDPTTITDFSPFVALLADSNIIKVLHACSEDLEVFEHQFNQLPEPMLDTQVMASFAGLGTSVGFAKLVSHYLGVELDKGASRTDWLARPLNDQQLQYAAADVWFLLPIYEKLSAELANSRWYQAVQEECIALLAKRKIIEDKNTAYRNITNAWRLNRQELAVLQILAKWRIEEAQKRNLALNFVVKEASLFQIAKIQPKHTSQLLEFMHPNEVRIHGKKLLWLVEQGRAILPENYPKPITRLVDEKGYKYNLQAMLQKLTEIQPLDLNAELIASKRQLNQLFKWFIDGKPKEKTPELLTGWRKLFGQALLTVLS
ncbi:ribonuclease D [Mannheimia granulomatis]|uniref:Ribonuclease D n=1 Tax=Mannheimia granulomatis TaxID=85402 RepID=A0A011P602_9PAST|nr:ribonuclease D [Mannheimia granulomatis]EXI61904.1 ribonuclease D [Mannheimia granulomatis]RGE49310.1 ribonuclease D [Mannheimia granulomatis]